MMSYPATSCIHFLKVATGINKNEYPLSVESGILKCTIGAFKINSPKQKDEFKCNDRLQIGM